MERAKRFDPQVCRTADVFERSYTLLRIIEGFKDLFGIRRFEFRQNIFEAEDMTRWLSKCAGNKFKELEVMGHLHLAWEIMEEIDSRQPGRPQSFSEPDCFVICDN